MARVNCDVTVSILQVVQGRVPVVTPNVSRLSIGSVEALGTEVVLEESLNELRPTVGDGVDASFTEPKSSYVGPCFRHEHLLLGGGVLGGGVGNQDECDVCAEFAIRMRYRVNDTQANAKVVDGHTDNSSPCPEASMIPCFAYSTARLLISPNSRRTPSSSCQVYPGRRGCLDRATQRR